MKHKVNFILEEDWPEPDPRYTINYLPYYGKFFSLDLGIIIDPKHPQCAYCGRFVKINWDRSYTGPCTNCYEDTRWL